MNKTLRAQAAPSHPTALWCLSLIYAFYMCAFGGILAALVLYLHTALHVDLKETYSLFAVFASLILVLPLCGGYLASKLGYRECASVGLCLALVGMALLAVADFRCAMLGLVFFVVGNGYFTPSLWCLVDHIYEKNDPRREAGFTLFYLFFNMGAVAAILLGGFLADHFGYRLAFSVDMIFLALGMLFYFLSLPRMLFAKGRSLSASWFESWLPRVCALTLVAALLIPFVRFLYFAPRFNDQMLYVFAALSVGSLLTIAKQQKSYAAKMKVYGFLLLSFISVAFWVLYNLEPSLLSVFIAHNVARAFMGFDIPASSFFAFEGLFVILFGLVLSRLWWYLGQRNQNPSLPLKFSLSLIFIAAGFVFLMCMLSLHGLHHYLPSTYMILAYVFFAIGELLIGPISLSMVGRLSPHGQEGLFMGVTQLFQGVGASIAGILAAYATVPDHATVYEGNLVYSHSFLMMGVVTACLGFFAFLLVPWVKRLL